jgi:hypothetical protein
MDSEYHETVADATIKLPSTDFLPGAKFFPVSPHTKRPAIIGWQAAATSDPTQRAAWAAQFPGCGWAIACAESGLLGVEIDPKARKIVKDKNSQQAGQERAEQAWRNMWDARRDVAPWPPHTRSPSGGSHFILRPPPGVIVKSLRQGGLVKLPGWQQHVIETRVNGYLLIPPSEFNGRVYTRPEGGPSEPYDAPPWLIEMMLRKTDTQPGEGEVPAPIVKPGSYDLRKLAKYICKVHHRVGLPRAVWMATIFALVAQYGRYVAWQIAQAIHDGEPDTSDQIDDLVGRASETFQPGDSTLNTLFKHARENGIHDVVPLSISFGFPADPLDINQNLREIDMEELKSVEDAPSLAPSAVPPLPPEYNKPATAAPPPPPDTSATALGPAMPKQEPQKRLLKKLGGWMRDFVAPLYLWEDILIKRFCYSMTAATGTGKTAVGMLLAAHVAIGQALCGKDVERGTVIYLAGENPTDVQMRFFGMCQTMTLDPDKLDIHIIEGVVDISKHADQIRAECKADNLEPSLVIVDTAAAYFQGDNANDNVQAGNYARSLRDLCKLPGEPCVLILCHPVKGATTIDQMIPVGGGAFLNEVDGNIALAQVNGLIGAQPIGKFRGVWFSPLHFRTRVVDDHPRLKNDNGKQMKTVVAFAVSEQAAVASEMENETNEERLLQDIQDHPADKQRERAPRLGCNQATVTRRIAAAKAKGLLDKTGWLTPAGRRLLNEKALKKMAHQGGSNVVPFPMPSEG